MSIYRSNDLFFLDSIIPLLVPALIRKWAHIKNIRIGFILADNFFTIPFYQNFVNERSFFSVLNHYLW